MSKKPQSTLRWAILFFSCIMMIANYYCYDNPAALQSRFETYMGPDNFAVNFSLLYSLYSLPNILLPFFGGFFIDKLGVRVCLLTFAGCITAGQIIFAFGLSIKSWYVMFLGRVIYGLGGESLGVGNSAVLSEWFKGKELAFAFGLNLSVARLGSVMNNNVSPILASASGLPFALWFGAILCAGSVVCVLLMAAVDKRYDEQRLQQGKAGEPLLDGSLQDDRDLEEEVKFLPAGSSSSSASAAVSTAAAAERTISIEGRPRVLSSDGPDAPSPELRDVFKFSRPFWVLTLSCVVVYGCVLPFNNIASSLLLERNYFIAQPDSACALAPYPAACANSTNTPNQFCSTAQYYAPPLPTGLDPATVDCTNPTDCVTAYCDDLDAGITKANQVMSIPYIISACLSPFLGGFVDRFGMRAVIATAAPAALIVVHSILGYASSVDPVGPLVGQGLAYAGFAAVLWPSVPLVVEQRFIGLGYGVVTSVQNLGLASFPLIVSGIASAKGGYIPSCENFFIALASLGVLVGLYLNVWDRANGGVFNNAAGAAGSGSGAGAGAGAGDGSGSGSGAKAGAGPKADAKAGAVFDARANSRSVSGSGTGAGSGTSTWSVVGTSASVGSGSGSGSGPASAFGGKLDSKEGAVYSVVVPSAPDFEIETDPDAEAEAEAGADTGAGPGADQGQGQGHGKGKGKGKGRGKGKGGNRQGV